MTLPLEQLMEESDSIIDLEERLKDFGHIFETCGDYINFLDKEWKKILVEKTKAAVSSSVISDNFPSLEVEVDDTVYYIHGITHGQRFKHAPGWQMRKRVKDFISSKAESFHDPSNGEDYLYEERIDEVLNLLKSQELRDVTSTMDYSNSSKGKLWTKSITIPLDILITIVMTSISVNTYLMAQLVRTHLDGELAKIYFSQRSLSDEKYLNASANIHIAEEMPQPFDFERSYIRVKNSLENKFLNSLYPGPIVGTTGERSLWTSKAARQYAKEHSLKKLHYIGGLGHSTEIAYFMTCPNYSFKKLEEFRLAKQK